MPSEETPTTQLEEIKSIPQPNGFDEWREAMFSLIDIVDYLLETQRKLNEVITITTANHNDLMDKLGEINVRAGGSKDLFTNYKI